VRADGFSHICLGVTRPRACLLGCRANSRRQPALSALDVKGKNDPLADPRPGAPGACSGEKFRGGLHHEEPAGSVQADGLRAPKGASGTVTVNWRWGRLGVAPAVAGWGASERSAAGG
jgi:hypothetical protein